jgi:hypothetical protein
MDEKVAKYLNRIRKKEGLGAAINAHAKIADKFDVTLAEAIQIVNNWQLTENTRQKREH